MLSDAGAPAVLAGAPDEVMLADAACRGRGRGVLENSFGSLMTQETAVVAVAVYVHVTTHERVTTRGAGSGQRHQAWRSYHASHSSWQPSCRHQGVPGRVSWLLDVSSKRGWECPLWLCLVGGFRAVRHLMVSPRLAEDDCALIQRQRKKNPPTIRLCPTRHSL